MGTCEALDVHILYKQLRSINICALHRPKKDSCDCRVYIKQDEDRALDNRAREGIPMLSLKQSTGDPFTETGVEGPFWIAASERVVKDGQHLE